MIALLALLPLALSAPAQEPDLDRDLAALRAGLVSELEALAGQAQDRKLYLQRDRAWAALLELDPQHRGARRALGYRRQKDGSWERRELRPAQDRGPQGALEEFAALRARRLDTVRDRVLALLAAPGVTPARRARELTSWLLLTPDDPLLHAALGETRAQDGRWLLTDTVAALARRGELAARVASARRAAPAPRPWSVSGPAATALEWRAAARSGVGRIAGTCAEEEVHADLEALWALEQLLDGAIEPPAPVQGGAATRTQRFAWRESFVVYLVPDKADVPRLVNAFPDLSAPDRELLPRLTSGWLRGASVLGVWGMDEVGRRDALSRQVVGSWLRDNFGISTRQGWAWEGFGLYLSQHAVGTRRTFFVRPSRYVERGQGPNLSERLHDDSADWFALLAESMTGEQAPRLSFLLGKDVNGLDERELLLAHGLAAWLVEARPVQATAVLDRMGRGQEPTRVLEEVSGMRLPEIEAHVTRWATEVSGG